MGQNYETAARTTITDLASKQPHELLLQLGGGLAALLSVVLFVVQWSQGSISANQMSPALVTLVLNLVLGGALWISSAIVQKNLMNGAIFAGVVSLVLLWQGQQAGLIGGLIGVLGAILAAASPHVRAVRR